MGFSVGIKLLAKFSLLEAYYYLLGKLQSEEFCKERFKIIGNNEKIPEGWKFVCTDTRCDDNRVIITDLEFEENIYIDDFLANGEFDTVMKSNGFDSDFAAVLWSIYYTTKETDEDTIKLTICTFSTYKGGSEILDISKVKELYDDMKFYQNLFPDIKFYQKGTSSY